MSKLREDFNKLREAFNRFSMIFEVTIGSMRRR
jgi:hypothetical protein